MPGVPPLNFKATIQIIQVLVCAWTLTTLNYKFN